MTDEVKVWVVGKYITHNEKGIVWDIYGVYEEKEMAIAACFDKYCFIGPVVMNESMPMDREEWPEVEYPLGSQA